jgi:hypothetical protein
VHGVGHGLSVLSPLGGVNCNDSPVNVA